MKRPARTEAQTSAGLLHFSGSGSRSLYGCDGNLLNQYHRYGRRQPRTSSKEQRRSEGQIVSSGELHAHVVIRVSSLTPTHDIANCLHFSLNIASYVQTDPAMNTHVEADTDDQQAGKVGCAADNSAQPRPAIGGLPCTDGRSGTDGNQGDRQANAEAQDEHATQCDLFNLKTQQQNGDGGWTRNQPPVNPNMTICPVVTSRLVKRLRMSLACARSCAS